jgi:very-short-patch-repair endonuclease
MAPLPDALRVTAKYGGKLAVDRWRALARLAARQHGVVDLGQLLELGIPLRTIDHWVERGLLHRLYRGVFAVGHRRLTLRGRWMAAVLACGDQALLSHRSSAHLRGYVKRSTAPEVTVTRKVTKRAGFRAYVVANLTAADRAVIDGIPRASPALTLLGLAAAAPADLPGALAQAAKRDELDLNAIDALLARRRRAPGTRALRDSPRAYRVEWEWTNSELERRAFELFAAAALANPAVNAWIDVPGGGFEVDFTWSSLRLAVEVDGWETHGDRHSFEEDRRRDALLSAAGWRVMRFTWRQVTQDPAFVVAGLRSVLATDARRGYMP